MSNLNRIDESCGCDARGTGRNLGQSAVHDAGAVSPISTLLNLCHLIVKQLSVREMSEISCEKSLNDLSAAYFFTQREKKSRFYEIEGVVLKRVRKGKVSESAWF